MEREKRTAPKQTERELKQKLIFFQKEAAKYKFLAEKYELIITNALLAKENTVEVKTSDPVAEKHLSECLSFFNYSFINEKDELPFIYGNFTIQNVGTTDLSTPIICLKANRPTQVVIGGKIAQGSNFENKLMTSFEEWHYSNENWRQTWLEKGELWIKPKETAELKPGEKLVFSGFDIQFKEIGKLKPTIIEGYCYFQQLPSGVKSLNSISTTL